MSDTPRTDAAEKHAYEYDDDMTPVVESNFARQLERELAEARESMPWYINGETKDEWFQRQRDKFSALDKELAEAREQIKKLEQWKREQMFIESGWSPHDVGRLLKMPLAADIRANIKPRILNLIEQRDRLADAIKRYIAEDYTLVALQRTLAAVEGGSK
jgi:hypothetical protein